MDTKQSQEFAQMKENSTSYSVIRHEQVDIFTIVTIETNESEENNTFIALGKARLTDVITEEECKRKIEEKDWDLITGVALYMNMQPVPIDNVAE